MMQFIPFNSGFRYKLSMKSILAGLGFQHFEFADFAVGFEIAVVEFAGFVAGQLASDGQVAVAGLAPVG